MLSLLYTWTSCFRMFRLHRIVAFLRESAQVCLQAFTLLFQNLYWFIIVDIILFITLGDVVLKALKIKADASHSVGGLVVFLLLVVNILSFIINTGFILFIKKQPDDLRSGMVYLKDSFLRYIHLSLFFSVLLFTSLLILLGLGITKFPGMNYLWFFIIPIKIIELLVVFFWLDSPGTFRDLFISCERAFNFFLYNIPLMILLLSVGLSLDMGIKLMIFGYHNMPTLLHMRLDNLGSLGTETITVTQFLLFKYAKFITDSLWIAMLFVLYNRWKKRRYTESLFEE